MDLNVRMVERGSLCSRSDQALRIKTKASSTNSTVTNITYSGNTGTGLRQFGVLIDQVREHRVELTASSPNH